MMTNTIEQVIAYARAHPTNNGGTWHNWCSAFVHRAGGFAGAFDPAWLAALASGPLNLDSASAPAGAIHYYSDQWGIGHVDFALGGDLHLGATNGATTMWGTAMGTYTTAEYRAKKPDMHHAGWSLRFGTETLAPSQANTAAFTESPLTFTPFKEPDMAALIITSPIGSTLVLDGIIAQGDNTPEEFAAVKGATTVTVSAAQHRGYLAQAAQKSGLPLVCRVAGEGGVYVLAGNILRPMFEQGTLAQIQTLGAPTITITPAERDAWLVK
jgi:hypothetical protein